jgi:hypothetical protein
MQKTDELRRDTAQLRKLSLQRQRTSDHWLDRCSGDSPRNFVSVVELLAMAAQEQAGSEGSARRISTGKKKFLARVLLRPTLEFPEPGLAVTHLVVHDCASWAIAVYIRERADVQNVPMEVSSHATVRLASLMSAVTFVPIACMLTTA